MRIRHSEMDYVRVSTGKVEINKGEEERIVTEQISGEIEKVILMYDKNCSEDTRIKIFTSDGEKIMDVVGNQNGIYYPRNWNVMNQKYQEINVASEYTMPPIEKYVNHGYMLIVVEGGGVLDIINKIELLINGNITKSEETITEEQKADDIINKSIAYKEDATINSETEGVYNPVHGRRRRIKEYMKKVLQDTIEKEKVSMDITKQESGLEEMSEFITDSVYSKKFDGISKAISDRIKDYLVRALNKGYPIEKIRDHIVREGRGEVALMQAETIARTEIQALHNAVREWSYKKIDKENKFLYRWHGPDDDRVTLVCKNIKARTIKGVSLDKLREIVKEESIKGGFDGSREWTPHYSCRHTFLRHFD